MINNTNKVYKLKITTLSPVHIGDMVDFEPTGYVIYNPSKADSLPTQSSIEPEMIICPECGYANPLNKVKGNPYCLECDAELELPTNSAKNEPASVLKNEPSYLYTFTPKQLSEALSGIEKKQLLDVARIGNFYRLEEFFKSKMAKIVVQATKHARVCPEITALYNQKYGNEQAQKGKENRFEIEKNISNPATGLAYIPASSLKGAVRTALMSARNQKIGLTYKDIEKVIQTKKGEQLIYKGASAEQRIYNYGNLVQDPFKYLKIGDTTPQDAYLTEICVARNYQRKSGQAQMPVNIEVIPHNTIFRGELMLAKNSLTAERSELPDNMQDIKAACNAFYGKVFEEEQSLMPATMQSLVKAQLQKPNTFLLRVGKHCGARSITADKIRRIWNHKRKYYMDKSTTFWLADNGTEKLPFGWCVVEFEEVR